MCGSRLENHVIVVHERWDNSTKGGDALVPRVQGIIVGRHYCDLRAGQVRRNRSVVLLCERVCPVTKSMQLAGEKSDGIKHFGGVKTPVNSALCVLYKYIRKLLVMSLKSMSFDSTFTVFLFH